MRLHRLQMTAFQPFAGSEEVDFDALGEAGLFLMQGETGAGKTAILDAVCFALFGHVPGVRDGAGRLRSDHSGADERTEVVLELTLSGRRLRITRSPKQERPKVRSHGMTEEPARALLELRAPDEGWSVLAERIDAVEHELAELLGLTITQFCQVVLLPQGAFAKFLHASSDEREKILQQLFCTDRYADAEMWLADRRRAADAEVYRGLDAVADIASRVAQVASEEPPENWREQPQALQSWLQGQAVLADAGEAAAEGRRDAGAHARRQVAARHAAAVTLVDRQRQHTAVLGQLAEHQAGRPERDRARGRLQAARRAAPVAVLEERAAAARASCTFAESLATAALERVTGQLAPLAEAITAGAAREQASQLRERAAVAGTLLEVEGALEHDQAKLTELRARLSSSERMLGGHQSWLQRAQSEAACLSSGLATARQAQAALPGLQRGLEDAHRRAQAAAQRDVLLGQLGSATDRAREAMNVELAARQAWLEAREQRLDGIAAELASELHDGKPCRVCGAPQHPAPAYQEPGQAVDAAAEQLLQSQFDAAAHEHERERSCCAQLERDLAAARALAGEEAAGELLGLARRARAEVADHRRLASGGAAAAHALAEHAQLVAERERERAQGIETIAALRGEVDQCEAGLEDARKRVQVARDGSGTITAQMQWLEGLAQEWTHAAGALEQVVAARSEAERGDAGARAEARVCGFGGVGEALAAAVPAIELERIEAAIDAFDCRLQRLEAIAQDPELIAAAAQARPDQEQAAAELDRAETELKDAQGAYALAQRQARELRELEDVLNLRLEALAPQLERQRLVRSVAGLVDGTAPANRMRMPLASYVLTARLEQIAQAASSRLQSMSAGRYVLAHCDERLGRTRKAGLGLQVLDAWTGRERPPSSLSGGETFQASLALALGLADVVTAESGGARLQTLFVDEGFGSLGERALDDVLDVLDGLREGGRAVGVISHVAEMRQRIPVQLHVQKGRHGSRILQR